MMKVRLLEGEDYMQSHSGEYAFCLEFCGSDCSESIQIRKRERGVFFQQLQAEQRGGILVAENEAGEVVGWFSFIDKASARQLLWPCRRGEGALERLVGVCLVVDHAQRGRGIGTMLADELVKLAQKWGYAGVEAACRIEDPHDPGLTWHTPAPFHHAGFSEVERLHCDMIYPADFIVMEYVF